MAVEGSTFGQPCPDNVRVSLKVVYACGNFPTASWCSKLHYAINGVLFRCFLWSFFIILLTCYPELPIPLGCWPVARNVFRDRYITPLEDDELDQQFELNELYDDEFTPAPNQVDDSSPGGQMSHKFSDEMEATVKAENILTQSKEGKP